MLQQENLNDEQIGLSEIELKILKVENYESENTDIDQEEITCSICFEELIPGEVIRTMPSCKHRFHSDCVDNWLKTKP